MLTRLQSLLSRLGARPGAAPRVAAPLVAPPTDAERELFEHGQQLAALVHEQRGVIDALRGENARLTQLVTDSLHAALAEHQRQAQVFGTLVDELRDLPHPIFTIRFPDDMTVH